MSSGSLESGPERRILSVSISGAVREIILGLGDKRRGTRGDGGVEVEDFWNCKALPVDTANLGCKCGLGLASHSERPRGFTL
jgi:hypothetical protein